MDCRSLLLCLALCATFPSLPHSPLQHTACPTDVAIDGQGYFFLSDFTLTRDGHWKLVDQEIRLAARPHLAPLDLTGMPLRLPQGTTLSRIHPDGIVEVRAPNGRVRPVARIMIVEVPHPSAPPPYLARVPGQFGMGWLRQGYLETPPGTPPRTLSPSPLPQQSM